MNFDVDTWKDVARELGADVSCRWHAADASVEVGGFYEIARDACEIWESSKSLVSSKFCL